MQTKNYKIFVKKWASQMFRGDLAEQVSYSAISNCQNEIIFKTILF